MIIPSAAKPLLHSFSTAFTKPTYQRWLVLLFSAVLTVGRRTVSNLRRTVQTLAPGDPSSYHRVFSKRRYECWKLSRALAVFILKRWVPEGPVYLAGDDTVDGHKGKNVYGKGCHRDAVRSTHSYTAYRWGHKWVVLAILVKFPFSPRPWALPVLVALYRSPEWNEKQARRHKTPAQLMRQMLCVMLRWFPERKFIFSGDGGFGTHDLAACAQRQKKRLALVSRFYPDANLYAPPPAARNKKGGRPRKKGRKLASPRDSVAHSKRRHMTVGWYGGDTRKVEAVTGTGHWYKSGAGLVPVRWVFVHDKTGTHRDEYFFSTDVDMSPRQIIETFTGRWSIEVAFQELRAHLGLETTRGWTEKTVLRAAPALFGLYSVVALFYAMLPQKRREQEVVKWNGKQHRTFSDAIGSVRCWLWQEWVFETGGHCQAFSKLPRRLRCTLLYALASTA